MRYLNRKKGARSDFKEACKNSGAGSDGTTGRMLGGSAGDSNILACGYNYKKQIKDELRFSEK